MVMDMRTKFSLENLHKYQRFDKININEINEFTGIPDDILFIYLLSGFDKNRSINDNRFYVIRAIIQRYLWL